MAAELASIQVPIVLRDWSGTELEISAPLTQHIFIRVGPCGGFLFDKTDEVNQNLRTVYKQRFPGFGLVYGPETKVIDVKKESESAN